VVTSHLGPLKLGWDENSGVVNGSLEYDNKTGKPTDVFLMGIPGQSLALQTAKRVGVNPQIIDQAREFLRPEIKKYHAGLEEVDRIKEDLRKLMQDVQNERAQAKAEKSKYHALAQKFEAEREKMLDQAV